MCVFEPKTDNERIYAVIPRGGAASERTTLPMRQSLASTVARDS